MKKKIIIASLLVLCLLFVILGVLFVNKDKKGLLSNPTVTTEGLNVVLNDNGVPKYISGAYSNKKVIDEKSALESLEDIKEMLGIESVSRELYLKEENSFDNVKYYEVQQRYNGIDVLGAELTISVDNEGNILGLNGSYIPNVKVNSMKSLSKEQIKEILINNYGENTELYDIEKKIIVVGSEMKLVYLVDILCDKGVYEVTVNASDGNITFVEDLVKNNDYNGPYTYTGEGINDTYTIDVYQKGKVYQFYDEKRNINIKNGINASSGAFDQFFNAKFNNYPIIQTYMVNNRLMLLNYDENTDNEFMKIAVTTKKYYEEIYDYYKDVLGRDSYDNKGSEINVSILYNVNLSERYYNANWNSWTKYITIGYMNDNEIFSRAKDVLAHEFTHGVVNYTSVFKDGQDVNKANEPGALNEAYADIMGSLVEDKDWIMADVFGDNYIRNLEDPKAKGNPDEKGGEYYWPDGYVGDGSLEEFLNVNNLETVYDLDSGGVHGNSTVVSHAAYLMFKNGAFSDKKEMARVWYNSLFLLSSYSNFEDCAYAVIQAAIGLGLTNEKIDIIKDAFYETKMLADNYYDLSGKVVDSDSDKSLENVLVVAANKKNLHVKFEVYTNSKGEYSFLKLPEGEYVLSYEKAKYETLEKSLNINNTLSFDVELEPILEEETDLSEIVFVMDISLSMSISDPTDIRKQIIANILASIDDKTKVALVIFAKNASVISDGLSDGSINKRVLATDIFNISNDDGTTSNSGTNGKAGLKKAISLFDADKVSKKYIVFLTDGQDNGFDSTTYQQLVDKAVDKKIRILAIGLGDELDEESLKLVATGTKGKYYHALKSSEIYKFDSRIFEELS